MTLTSPLRRSASAVRFSVSASAASRRFLRAASSDSGDLSPKRAVRSACLRERLFSSEAMTVDNSTHLASKASCWRRCSCTVVFKTAICCPIVAKRVRFVWNVSTSVCSFVLHALACAAVAGTLISPAQTRASPSRVASNCAAACAFSF